MAHGLEARVPFLDKDFLDVAMLIKAEEKQPKKKTKPEKKTKKKQAKPLPVNEVFDILPVSGTLQPGQTETVEFTFYSGHGLLYNGVAVCSVDGGPDYEVPIVGESSFVSYKLSALELDYGEIPYNESSSKEFFIENIGKVPFQFNINLSTVSRPGLVDCHPMTGKVAAGERYKVIVKFFPGIPSNIDEMFLVECAHFPAQRFKVRAIGIFPACLLSFPRSDDEEFHRFFDDVKKIMQRPGGVKTDYSAVFTSGEAIKQMAPLPKAIEKDKSLVKEPFVMEVEAEVDRRMLCEKILAQIEAATQRQMYATSSQLLNSTANLSST
jgi:hydrocephalus-inducing protein